MPQRTIPQLFEDSVLKYPNNNLMWEKTNDNFIGTTYSKLKDEVYKFAAGLMSKGLKKGDKAALISEGRNRWLICELGILYCGAVNVPISVKIDESSDLKFRLSHSETKFVIVSNTQVEKIRKIKNDLPDLEKIIIMDKLDAYENDEILYDDLIISGENYLAKNERAISESLNNLNENDYANICYTSGTTADPKGILLTHRNYTSNVEQASAILNVPESFLSLLILPWDHAFAHTAGIYTLMKNGASMASVQLGRTALETLKNIPVNIKETNPTFLLSVPALAKSFRKNIEKGIREKGPKIEKLFNSALKLAYDYNSDGFNRGKGVKILKMPLYQIYDRLIFKKIREGFGSRLSFFIGGGALLDIELQRFFYAIGIPMYQGYGLTEAAPIISANVPKRHKLGSSGSIVPNLKVKICDEKGNELPVGLKGEIVVKGENVMAGYWKNETATSETIRNGWLYTGDLGYLDSDGFLYVLGRNKSLLIGSDGEKYSPEGIEEAITENSVFIDQLMLYNNQSPYTVAFLVPNRENILRWTNQNSFVKDLSETHQKILNLLQSEIDKFKSGGEISGKFPERWLPSAIAVLGEGFTEQNKFLNSTLKMVRGKITEYYKPRIDFLYTPEAKNIANHQNLNIIKRMLEE